MRASQFPGAEQLFRLLEGEAVFANGTRDVGSTRECEEISTLFDSEFQPVGQSSHVEFSIQIVHSAAARESDGDRPVATEILSGQAFRSIVPSFAPCLSEIWWKAIVNVRRCQRGMSCRHHQLMQVGDHISDSIQPIDRCLLMVIDFQRPRG
jgi:hypothetical protein